MYRRHDPRRYYGQFRPAGRQWAASTAVRCSLLLAEQTVVRPGGTVDIPERARLRVCMRHRCCSLRLPALQQLSGVIRITIKSAERLQCMPAHRHARRRASHHLLLPLQCTSRPNNVRGPTPNIMAVSHSGRIAPVHNNSISLLSLQQHLHCCIAFRQRPEPFLTHQVFRQVRVHMTHRFTMARRLGQPQMYRAPHSNSRSNWGLGRWRT